MGDAIFTRRFSIEEAQLNVVKDGLLLYLDAGNSSSYGGSGTTWNDLSGNGFHFTLSNGMRDNWSGGVFTLSEGRNARRNPNPITTSTSTVVMIMKTTDTQALFVSGPGQYLAAYSPSNKMYFSGLSPVPTFHISTVQRSNVYDFIRTGNWHMIEFKNAGMSSFSQFIINDYGSFNFDTSTQLAAVLVYNRVLTLGESQQNLAAFQTRLPLV